LETNLVKIAGVYAVLGEEEYGIIGVALPAGRPQCLGEDQEALGEGKRQVR
jgi:hypothetical protein